MLFMAVWQRKELTVAVFDHIKELQERWNIDVFVVYSEWFWTEILLDYGFKGVGVTNDPLGYKHNMGLQRCLERYEFDYLMQIGSDDFIDMDGLMELYDWDSHDVFGINTAYAYDLRSDSYRFVRAKDVAVGAGRVFKREILERLMDNVLIPYWKVLWVTNGMKYGYGYTTGDYGKVSADRLMHLIDKDAIRVIGPIGKDIEKIYTRYAFDMLYPEPQFSYNRNKDFYLWPNDAQRGLDTKSQAYLEANAIDVKIYDTTLPLVVDVKADHDNLNSFDTFTKIDDNIDSDTFYSHDFLRKARQKAQRGVGGRKFEGVQR